MAVRQGVAALGAVPLAFHRHRDDGRFLAGIRGQEQLLPPAAPLSSLSFAERLRPGAMHYRVGFRGYGSPLLPVPGTRQGKIKTLCHSSRKSTINAIALGANIVTETRSVDFPRGD